MTETEDYGMNSCLNRYISVKELGSNPNEACNAEGLGPTNARAINVNSSINMGHIPTLLGGLSAGKSLEHLPYESAKMTPSVRLRVQSIKSPFYKHPPLAELRRAKTPNNYNTFHSRISSQEN